MLGAKAGISKPPSAGWRRILGKVIFAPMQAPRFGWVERSDTHPTL